MKEYNEIEIIFQKVMKNRMNKYKLTLLIELLIGIALTLSFLGYQEVGEDIFLPNSIAWLPFAAYGLLLIGLIIEYRMGHRPLVRMVMLVIFILVGLICFGEGYGFVSIALSVTGIPYLIALIIANIRGGQPIAEAKIKKDNILSPGVVSKRDIHIQYGLWAGIILLVVLVVVLLNALKLNVWYSFLSLPVILIIFVVITYKTNTLIQLLKEINQKMDYESFEGKIDEILKTNIHPETYNYLMIIKVNYLFSYNVNQGLELFSTLKKPENKKYLMLYHSVLVEGLIHLGKYDEAYEQIQQLNEPLKAKLLNFYNVFCTNEELKNIEALYPTNQKIKFSNASAMFTKMFYYQSRGDVIKAQELAKILIEYAPKLLYFKQEAEKILENDTQS